MNGTECDIRLNAMYSKSSKSLSPEIPEQKVRRCGSLGGRPFIMGLGLPWSLKPRLKGQFCFLLKGKVSGLPSRYYEQSIRNV